MKDSGGNNKKNALSYKTLALVLIAVLSVVFFAFGGWNRVQSAIVDLQKRFADNEEIDGKERTDNGDGTYKLSLSVTGDAATIPEIKGNANVLIIYDVSGSMEGAAYKYTKTTSNNGTQYGLRYGRYVELNRSNGRWYYSGTNTEYNGDRFIRTTEADNRYMKAEKVVYDFTTALKAYNDITPNTVSMAMVTFSSQNHSWGAGTKTNATWLVHGTSDATAWTTDLTNISKHLTSNGTTRPAQNLRITYGGGTNWEAALQRGKDVVDALPNDRKNYDTFVIFVTDGAPTYRLSNGSGTGTEFDIANYRNAMDDAKRIQDTNNKTNLYGIYAFGNEENTLDDLVYYAYNGVDRTVNQQAVVYEGTAAANNYYSATDTSQLETAINDIFSQLTNVLGIGEVTINDGTTSNVETTSGEISHLLVVDSNSFTYGMAFPATPVTGQTGTYTITRKNNLGQNYNITLSDNGNGTFTATWGDKTIENLPGKYSLGKFYYDWIEENEFYNVAPPAATYNTETGAVDWNLDRETVGTLLDDVTYTVYFDVYPSQYTYDTVAKIKNATDPQAEYDKLDANEKKYLKYEDGEVTLETNKQATLTYTDNRNGNTTPTTKTYKNPDPVVTDSSRLDVEKVWLNKEDKKFVPDGLSVKMELVRDNVDTGLELTLNKTGDWTDNVAIATGLMRTKVVDGKTVVEVLDSGHDYTLKETSIEGNIKDYQWELELETVHPMIINGQLTTLVEVPSNEIPTGMTSADQVYTHNNHTFYRFNGKVYYDKVVPTTGQDQTNAKLNAYNIRKSNFNFTKKVEGDPVGGEFFNFTFKVNDANIDETNIPADATDEDKMNNYSVWFSVCDSNKLAAMGKSCEDTDAWQYYEKDLVTSATPEEGDTGYYYALDNTNITLSIKDGWNVRVTNIGTGSTYNITEAAPTSPFELTNIDGNVLVSVPELPANAVETSDGVYDVNGVEYRRVTETDAAGVSRTVYQYTYEPETNVPNRTISGVIVAPNNTYGVTFTNTYPKTHLTVTKDWHVADSAKKPVNTTLYRSVQGGEKQKVTQEGLTNPVTLNASNNWTYDFKDLDVKDATGKVYDYFTEEQETTGGIYVTTYAGLEDIVVNATNIPTGTESIAVNVKIGTDTQTVTLTEANNWKATVEGVSYLNEDGTPKYVSVQTDSNATINYALTNRTNTITNEERVNISGTKTWIDGPYNTSTNQDGLRPDRITIYLNADGDLKEERPVTPAPDGTWTYAFNNLPKYKAVTTTDEDGNTTTTYELISYTITEAPVSNYSSNVSGYNVTNTHIPFETTVTVIKHWSDDNNRDGIRPSSVSFKVTDKKGLMIPGFTDNTTLSLTNTSIDEDGNWIYTKTGLPRRAAGVDINYSVTEITRPTGYQAASADEPRVTEDVNPTTGAKTFTIEYTNEHTPTVVDVSGEKIWSDDNDQDGKRPAAITVKLMAKEYDTDGETVLNEAIDTGRTINLPNADGSWTYSFGDMPEYQTGAQGHKLEYYVVETTTLPTGYVATSVRGEDGSYNVNNAYTPEITYKTGEKTWVDNNNQDGKRPSSITVILTGKIPQKDEDGNIMRDDDNNIIYNPRPVYTSTQTVTPDEDGNWTYRFDNIPKYADHGTEIKYTVTDIVDGYTASDDSMDLTNTLVPETVDVEGRKIWKDGPNGTDTNQDGIRPQSITVTLVGTVYADDGETVLKTINTGKTAQLPDKDGNWTYKFENLPKNTNMNTIEDPDIREITYTVTDDVPGYTATSKGYDVENFHKPSEINIEGIKVWNDASNQDGIRPTSITVILTGKIPQKDEAGNIMYDENNNIIYNPTPVVNRTVDITVENAVEGDNDRWAYIFEGVPEYQEGLKVEYTVEEVNNLPQGYTSKVDETDKRTITNTYIPKTEDVIGYKIWNDANNQDGKRPKTSISITLTGTIDLSNPGSETVIIRTVKEETIQVTENDKVQITENGVTSEHAWGWSWKNLPQYYEGHEITYTISETQVPEYNEPVVNGYNVTNTHKPETTKVEGTKTWKDENNQDSIRPSELIITLHAKVEYTDETTGEKVSYPTSDDGDTKTVTAADDWAWSWEDLPKYDNGHEITYTVTENFDTEDAYLDDYYTGSEDPDNDNSFINTHNPFETKVIVIKKWDDGNNQDGLRDTVTFRLTNKQGLMIPDAHGDTTFRLTKDNVDSEGNWIVTKDGLPRRVAGEEIEYSAIEISSPSGYNPLEKPEVVKEKDDDKLGNQIFTITYTNKHTPTTVAVEGTKTWNDDSDRDRIRPQSIYITVTGRVSYTDEETGEEIKDKVISTNTKQVTASDAVEGDSNKWAYSWPTLPEYNNGHKITYTITETDSEGNEITAKEGEPTITGYKAPEYDGYNVTNTHEIETTSVSGKKVWSDDNNRDVIRPTSVVVTLFADGVEVESKSVNVTTAINDNEWAFTFDNLPAKNAGQTITYTVREKDLTQFTDTENDVPTGYTQTVSGTTITNTHIPEPTTLPITKVWDDDNDRDGKRPDTITVYVYDNDDQNTIVKTETVKVDDKNVSPWNYTITGLKKFKNVDGVQTPITYVIKEAQVDGYLKPEVSGTQITNTRVTEKMNLPITKTWVDNGDSEHHRPEKITIKLLADGVDTGKTITLPEDGKWESTFTDLPVNKDHGTGTVIYTVEEVIEKDSDLDKYYDVSYPATKEGEGKVIVNTIKDLSKDILVAKVWDDENDRDNVRQTVTFTLKGTVPGEEKPIVTRTIILSKENNLDPDDSNRWKGVFEKVPIFYQGTWITYTVDESGVDNQLYPTTTSETAKDGTIVITNSHSHLLKDIEAFKVWSDNEDNDGKRPESVKITLFADGVEKETLEATAATGWKVKFENYPVNREGKVGKPIEYTVREKDAEEYGDDTTNLPEGYTQVVSGTTITNTHDPITISYKVTKNWEDFENNDGKRPDHITVRLVGKVGEEVIKNEVLEVYEINEGFENESWTYAFTNLPKYYNKQLVQYTLTEDEVDLYDTEKITQVATEESTTEITNEITNTHDKIPYNNTGMITVNKYWYDENDKYKKRPGSITVNLLADGEIYQTAELTAENSWTVTFENLPMYTIRDGEVGCEIVYSIQEVAVENYETTIDGFDITNTYNGPVPEITPPNTGVAMTKRTDNNVLFEMILTMLATTYTVVVLRKANEQ